MDESHGGIFTGERLVADDPLFAADIARHLVAYRFAAERCAGREVLDAGCGDGYGSNHVAQVAAAVVGVDRSPDTIAVARRRYRRDNLGYEVCDLDSLERLGRTFDVVCNFQVLEHLDDPLPFLRQVRAVLRPGGLLILTTPNRATSVVAIPFHVKEYLASELAELLGGVFPSVDVQGIARDERALEYDRVRIRNAERIMRLDPLNLRRFLPKGAIDFLYPHLVRVVRRAVQREQADQPPVTADNFFLTRDYDVALDLLAVCRAGD